jgi:hypothetical protein
MGGFDGRRRVLVPQALGADEFLRVTWHEGRQVIVFSQWEGDRCIAATPVRVADIGELVELTVTAFTQTMRDLRTVWDPPHADELVAGDLDARRPA